MDRDPSASRRRLTPEEESASDRRGILPYGSVLPLCAGLLLFDVVYWGYQWREWAAEVLAAVTAGSSAAGLAVGVLLGLSALPVLIVTWITIQRASEGTGARRLLTLIGGVAVNLVMAPFYTVLIGARNGSDFDSYFNRRVPNAQAGFLTAALVVPLALGLLALWIFQGRTERKLQREITAHFDRDRKDSKKRRPQSESE
jgi:hypothetical protein